MPTKSLQRYGEMGFTWLVCRFQEVEILQLSVQNKRSKLYLQHYFNSIGSVEWQDGMI
ncbi:hypothetical protein DPMN_147338 [Dreissena polymorpha]|uniref:Uncharacterized protein n=1 Tax=Dreissena polymorpha TaxID=45954 RepID=A0A9D4F9P5_DREPO|nr:hypothetical protein DPMN_147338 [Dreissena polymorpha]